jgi:hypothetical protein
MHARKRGVESFEKREKDVKRGENKEKSMSMEKKVSGTALGVPLNKLGNPRLKPTTSQS